MIPHGLSIKSSQKLITQMEPIWRFYQNDQNYNIFIPENINFLSQVMEGTDSRLFNKKVIESYNFCLNSLSTVSIHEDQLAAEEYQIKLWNLWNFLQTSIICFLLFQYDKNSICDHHFNHVVWKKIYWKAALGIFQSANINIRTYLALHGQFLVKLINTGCFLKQKEAKVVKLINQLFHLFEVLLVQLVSRKKITFKRKDNRAFQLISKKTQVAILAEIQKMDDSDVKALSEAHLLLLMEAILHSLSKINWCDVNKALDRHLIIQRNHLIRQRQHCLSHILVLQDNELLKAFQSIPFQLS